MADYPKPAPALVIRYAYLWTHEHEKGLVDGRKDRPCVVILAMQRQGNDLEVTVSPITHTIPEDPQQSVELTDATRRRLGLDGERSWASHQRSMCSSGLARTCA